VEETLPIANRPAVSTSVGGAAARTKLSALLGDFHQSFKSKGLWLYSAWFEILLGYRSTVLGPLWIMIGTGLFVFVIGSLYGRVVLAGESNVYLAHLSVGIVLWYFILQSIMGPCRFFYINRSNILDGASTYTDLLLKLTTTNIITLLHNLVIVVLAFLYVGLVPSETSFIVLFTAPLVLANLMWLSVAMAILGARYSDLYEIVRSVLRLMFFLTPILWVAHQHVRGALVDAVLFFNPFYYFIEVIRGPLVYAQIPYFEIAVLIAALPIGWLAVSFLYARTKPWIALWL